MFPLGSGGNPSCIRVALARESKVGESNVRGLAVGLGVGVSQVVLGVALFLAEGRHLLLSTWLGSGISS